MAPAFDVGWQIPSLTEALGQALSPFLPFLSASGTTQPVPLANEARLPQPSLPAFPGANTGRVGEQSVSFLLSGEPGELLIKGMVRGQELFLAVQHGRVAAVGKVVAVELPGAQRQPQRAEQGRVWVRLKRGIDQVGQLAACAVELDEVGSLDVAEVGPAAALVDP
jgi:hypothetical protein